MDDFVKVDMIEALARVLNAAGVSHVVCVLANEKLINLIDSIDPKEALGTENNPVHVASDPIADLQKELLEAYRQLAEARKRLVTTWGSWTYGGATVNTEDTKAL
jgi:3-deoxy-D-arabino-heptulosonate 7-phosphate (DAHP) synthase class II